MNTSSGPLADGTRANSPVFATTHWSVVLAAGATAPGGTSEGALEQLCRSYWHPVYHFIRRQGFAPADAQDLTQEFFARFLERRGITAADPLRGRFRSFLLASVKHFLADERDRQHAQKRGGGRVFQVDFNAEESRMQHEYSGPGLTPDRAYDRRWALALLEHCYEELEREAAAESKAAQFAVLRPVLMDGRGAVRAAEMARALNISEGAARVAIHRLRRRFRELLVERIAATVTAPAEVETEFACLLEALAG